MYRGESPIALRRTESRPESLRRSVTSNSPPPISRNSRRAISSSAPGARNRASSGPASCREDHSGGSRGRHFSLEIQSRGRPRRDGPASLLWPPGLAVLPTALLGEDLLRVGRPFGLEVRCIREQTGAIASSRRLETLDDPPDRTRWPPSSGQGKPDVAGSPGTAGALPPDPPTPARSARRRLRAAVLAPARPGSAAKRATPIG